MAAKPKKKNPRLASGRKRVRQDTRLRVANSALRSRYRTAIKSVDKAIAAGETTNITALFQSTQKILDTIAGKGIFHKNKAARHKSRLNASIKAMA